MSEEDINCSVRYTRVEAKNVSVHETASDVSV